VALDAQLARFPDEVAAAAREEEPHRIAVFCLETAQAFDRFYPEAELPAKEGTDRDGWLALVAASRLVLENALSLIGVSAPERTG
jgi:arginyl-tRNA synthetase